MLLKNCIECVKGVGNGIIDLRCLGTGGQLYELEIIALHWWLVTLLIIFKVKSHVGKALLNLGWERWGLTSSSPSISLTLGGLTSVTPWG